MAETYSLGLTGVAAGNAFQPKNLIVGDSACQSPGDEQQFMATGTQFLVKMPDGSQVYHVYDAERSIPGVSRVLRRV